MKDGKLLHQGSPQKILQVLEGKVWECLLPPAYAEKLCTEKSFPIVNIRQEEENVLLRLVSSQKPSEDAWQSLLLWKTCIFIISVRRHPYETFFYFSRI